jgi:RNA polymerase sigma factor (sigma-70 family)
MTKAADGSAARAPFDNRISPAGVALLFTQLRSADAETAWKEFLLQYSSVLYQSVLTFTRDEDDASDCFVHICEQLVRNRFRRLLQFKIDGAASFNTWLRVVTRNLCYDWHRKKYGRLRPFKSVQSFSALELEVYRCRYDHGLSREETLQRLRTTWPALTGELLPEIESRIEGSLNSRQRWLLSARRQREPSTLTSDTDVQTCNEAESAVDTGPNPETIVADSQQRAVLHESLRLLPPVERLIVHLRFEEELSLEEIAQLTGLGGAQRVHRRIAAIVQKLREAMAPRTDRKITSRVREIEQESK